MPRGRRQPKRSGFGCGTAVKRPLAQLEEDASEQSECADVPDDVCVKRTCKECPAYRPMSWGTRA